MQDLIFVQLLIYKHILVKFFMYASSNNFLWIALTALFPWKAWRLVGSARTTWGFQASVEHEKKIRKVLWKAEVSLGCVIRADSLKDYTPDKIPFFQPKMFQALLFSLELDYSQRCLLTSVFILSIILNIESIFPSFKQP